MFTCNCCDYKTKYSSNFDKHTKSRKHQVNAKLHSCSFCLQQFNNETNLSNHINICVIKSRIDSMNSENNSMRNEIAILKKQVENYEKDKKLFLEIIENIRPSTKITIRNITYASNHYNIDLPLTTFNNFDLIKEFDGRPFEDTLNHCCKHKMLAKFIGKIIVNKYKESYPHNQTFWVSDMARKNFIVRCSDNGKCKWIDDKKGCMIKEKIITPIINYIVAELENAKKHQYNVFIMQTHREDFDSDLTTEYADLVNNYNHYIDNSKNGYLANEIINYLVPHFIMNHSRNSSEISQINGNDKGDGK